MVSRKRGTSVTGDHFAIEHPSLDLSGAFSSHVDVTFDGVTHQVLSTAGIGGFSFANTVSDFTVSSLDGFIIETLDTIATQVVHRHQAILHGADGALSVHGYDGAPRLLELLASARPQATSLGMTINPDASVDVSGPAKVALTTPAGLVQITPITTMVEHELPTWRGTPVDHGDLYAASLPDASPQLVLVTATCRVVLMPAANITADTATDVMASLAANWRLT